jgi:cation diffusion facilitator family transporter
LLGLVTKDNNLNDKNTRVKVGYLASFVGLIANVLLSVLKLTIGFLISSISVTADGINNLSDAASSIISIIGFKLSNMPADKEHPYGHGRIEYITALMVAFMVILVGFQFIQTSYKRIVNPLAVKFEIFSFIILIISISVKIWLSIFYKDLGQKIDSSVLKATSSDALGDVLTTSVVVVSIVIGRYTALPIDGFMGILVSLLIMYNGFNLVKDTISPLIGEAPNEGLIKSIYDDVLNYEHITGAHDLVVHTYGVGRTMATIDVEFPAYIDNITIHDVIDSMEREIGEQYNLTLVVHMDPLGPESKERYQLRKEVKEILKENPAIKSIHDFQILENNNEKTIEFHLVVNGNKMSKNTTDEIIKEEIEKEIVNRYKNMNCNVIVDIEY